MRVLRDLYKDGNSRNSVILYTLCLLPFFKPGSLAELNIRVIEMIYAAAEVVVTLAVIASVVKNKNSLRDPFIISAILLTSIVLISTIVNGQSLRNWLGQWAPRFAVILLSYCAMRRRPTEYIAAVLTLSSILCIINLSTVVAFPDGMYQTASTFEGDNYFLGHRNGTGLYILLMLVSSLLLENYKAQSLQVGNRTWVLYVIGWIQTMGAFSATTAISLFVFGAGLLAIRSERMNWMINPIAAVAVGAISNIAVVVFRIQVLFSPLIEGVLHREVSLSSRTTIWDITFDLISGSNLLLGRGVDGHRQIIIRETVINSAHNEILNTVLQAGLIGLAAYSALVGSVVYGVLTSHYRPLIQLTALFLITIFIMGVASVTTSVMMYLALALLYFSSQEIFNAKMKDRYKEWLKIQE